MTLYAKTAITGPNGEQVDAGVPIPDAWDINGEFVREGVLHGWLVEGDAPAATTLPAVPPPAVGPPTDGPPGSDPYAALALDVSGTATREGKA